MSVIPKNRQLVFSIRNYIRDTSEIFSTFSLLKISLTSFLCFSFVFRLVFFLFSKNSYLCNKKKYTLVWTYEVYLLVEKRFHSFVALTREIFFALKEKLHMFAPTCNILYVSYVWFSKPENILILLFLLSECISEKGKRSCFKFYVDRRRSWFDAKATCSSEEASLALLQVMIMSRRMGPSIGKGIMG